MDAEKPAMTPLEREKFRTMLSEIKTKFQDHGWDGMVAKRMTTIYVLCSTSPSAPSQRRHQRRSNKYKLPTNLVQPITTILLGWLTPED